MGPTAAQGLGPDSPFFLPSWDSRVVIFESQSGEATQSLNVDVGAGRRAVLGLNLSVALLPLAGIHDACG
jgi:hypothetical protein